MRVSIFSRAGIQSLIDGEFPANAAVISFYSPAGMKAADYAPVDYRERAQRLMYVCTPDLDLDALPRFGLSYETFMPEADALADFIRQAAADGMDIVCQCDYGQSRSAACCAAILEFYESRGIEIFANYAYYPNQVVFNRVLEALRVSEGRESKP